jgi:endonuclease-3 related protein
MADQGSGKGTGAEGERVAERLLAVYERLLAHYGPQGWWPAQSRFEMIIGAILVQAVAWPNVERALANLKGAGALAPAALQALPGEALADLIRPARFYRAKARKIKAFVAHLEARYGLALEGLLAQEGGALRRELLSIYGIGPETADAITLYAAGRPVFVADAYTRRLLARLGLVAEGVGYEALRGVCEAHLPREVSLFQEFHALIVAHAKSTCRREPLCAGCPLVSLCGFGQSQRALGK